MVKIFSWMAIKGSFFFFFFLTPLEDRLWVTLYLKKKFWGV